MLNEKARKRAETILEDIELEIAGEPSNFDLYGVSEENLNEIKWLAKTVIEMDNRYNEHKNCCDLECAYRKEIEG